MARPTKLTPALQAAIVGWLERGATYEVAAQCEGIDDATFYRWLQRGASESEGPYCEFRQAVARARARAEQEALSDIRTSFVGESANPDWRARDRWLQLTNPDRYSPTLQVKSKVENELREAIERLRAGLDTPTFERVLRILSGVEEPSDGDSSIAAEDEGGSEAH